MAGTAARFCWWRLQSSGLARVTTDEFRYNGAGLLPQEIPRIRDAIKSFFY